MDIGIQLVFAGAVLVMSLLLRNAAARHIAPGVAPAVLAHRLQSRSRIAPMMLLVGIAVLVSGLMVVVGSQIATGL